MSDVKRWKETESWGFTEWDCMAVMEECDNGDYVLYSDYARLKAEVERLRASSFVTAVPVEEYDKLKAEVERLTERLNRHLEINDELDARCTRLRKAGDAMAKRTEFFQKRWDADELCQEVEDWNAAKEGKQP